MKNTIKFFRLWIKYFVNKDFRTVQNDYTDVMVSLDNHFNILPDDRLDDWSIKLESIYKKIKSISNIYFLVESGASLREAKIMTALQLGNC